MTDETRQSPAETVSHVDRHPGPFTGPDADLARACAMAVIPWYGNDDEVTHQRIVKDGIWNDHVAVQAALAAIHHLTKAPTDRATPQQQLDFLMGEARKALAVIAGLPLQEYFRRHAEGDKLALAIEEATDLIAVALNVLSAQPKQLSGSHRPEFQP